jgi:transcription elongation GreA/GreB family factor
MNTDKTTILGQLIVQLSESLAQITESQRETQAGTIHEESRQEDPKDTRAIESSYLARGLARRVSELTVALAALESLELRRFDADTPLGVSALVTLQDEDGRLRRVFLAPSGGGLRVGRVQVATPQAPLFRAMVGEKVGCTVTVQTPKGSQELEIVEVV